MKRYFCLIMILASGFCKAVTREENLEKLRNIIWYELLHTPDEIKNFPQKELNEIKKIWHRGGHRKRISNILSKENLSETDIRNIRSHIHDEFKLVESKLRDIVNVINQVTRREVKPHLDPILSKLDPILSKEEIKEEMEKIISDLILDPEKVIANEKKRYKEILNKLDEHLQTY